MNRPDYVACVRTGRWTKPEDEGGQPETKTWCDRLNTGVDFYFVDVSHAALNAVLDGRLLICSECSAKIIKVLKKGTYRD